MVLTQPSILKVWRCKNEKFPYHYGSYATELNVPIITGAQLNVSIPLWFLRNLHGHGVVCDNHSGFHTTMVLTQPLERSREGESGRVVSIPLWFLRNNVLNLGDSSDYSVSIPLWFLRNISSSHLAPASRRVSIPLWFLRNALGGKSVIDALKFPYHYGSYATQCFRGKSKYPSLVSIPLWFLRNTLKYFYNVRIYAMFPYHYGSYATRFYYKDIIQVFGR